MTLTYAQIDSIATNATFLGRVRTAVASHAKFRADDSNSTADQKSWASRVFLSKKLSQIAADLAPELCQDSKITTSTTGDGSDITDSDLSIAVNAICEKYSGG